MKSETIMMAYGCSLLSAYENHLVAAMPERPAYTIDVCACGIGWRACEAAKINDA